MTMKLSVIGAGYVGLTTAACLAHIGHEVFCAESDDEKLRMLQNGQVPIYEPGVDRIMADSVANGRLRFGTTQQAIQWGEAIFICVGTPPLPNGDADLSYIESVARTIAKTATGYRLVIEKSTVPVQTGWQLKKYLDANSTARITYDVASNPEFLREGSAVGDFLHPERIVVGVDSERAEKIMREIYAPIVNQNFACPVHTECPKAKDVVFMVTDTKSSELIKHASNSFLAMKISFINMVADLCEAVGADVSDVAEGMGLDSRIGHQFLNPGIGFGGFCFPKDVQAFVRIAEKSGCDFALLQEVENINRRRIERFLKKVREEVWVLRGKKIAVWGLAFKPNTDDVRFAPSITLIQALQAEGAVVSAYDPQAMEKARPILSNVQFASSPYEAADGAHAVLIVTEWKEFREMDWTRLRQMVERPLILDGRNMFRPADMLARGFEYVSVGRNRVAPPRDADPQELSGVSPLAEVGR
jgi:UDPglucose 6-dehydrogenase